MVLADLKIDGKAVDKYITKKLSCGDCPMPCKGIVKVKSRDLTDVRRPDYETIIGFGANLLNDDIELVTAEKIGIETTTYVRNIYKYYAAYKLMIEAQAKQDKAREQLTPGKNQ